MPSPAPTYLAEPSRPTLRLPPGAWDTHCHVFGPPARFPYSLDRPKPADAPKENLFALHERLGIERCVIVNSAVHGPDNRVVEDAMAAKRGDYLGIALLPTSTTIAELRRLDRAGFRGVRFNFMKHLKPEAPISDVLAFAPRLAEVGWHLQVHMEADVLAELGSVLARAPVPVVIDHIGRVDAGLGLKQPPFAALMRLMESPKFWVKVSGCDRITRQGPPYDDAVAFARALVESYSDRVVWGTDWPHPNHRGPVPDDGALVDLIARMAPAEVLRHKLMVDNPVRLYLERAHR
jgi:2-pyrone-4,6-dicarboxylate lactonase